MTVRTPSLVLAFTLSAALAAAPSAAFAAGSPQGRISVPQRADKAIASHAKKADNGRIPVIVKARPGQTETVASRLSRKGVKNVKKLVHAGALVASLRLDEMAALEAEGLIEGFSLDAPVRGAAVDTFDVLNVSALRSVVAAPPALSGQGIGVAVVDSGIAPLPGLVERISAFYDFTSGTSVQTEPVDGYGHGTHVAGIVGGLFADGVSGIAPSVRLVGLRVLDNAGGGRTSAVIQAIDFAVASRAALGIDVLNLSLGHPIYENAATDPLVLAVERAVRAGIVVVVSAGNMGKNPTTGELGYGGITSPGNAPSAITVGASNGASTISRLDDRVTDFSSRGPTWFNGGAKPDVVAPGAGIVSALAPGSVLGGYTSLNVTMPSGQTYLRLSGTSMAAPVVSGVVALVIEASRAACPALECPPIAPKAVKAILQYTATPITDANGVKYGPLVQGRGEANADAAAAVAASIDTRMAFGESWLIAPLAGSTLRDGETWNWSKGIIWGARVLEGNVLAENELAWSDTIVWGTSTDLDTIVWGTSLQFDTIVWGTSELGTWSGDTIVWGTSTGDYDTIVWGTNAVWDDTIVWGTNIVWGDTVVGYWDGDTIVWGTSEGDTIVWGTAEVSALCAGTCGD